MSGRQLHRMWTFVLSTAMAAIGLALLVQGFVERSANLVTHLLLGVLFIAAGLARAYVEVRRGGRS